MSSNINLIISYFNSQKGPDIMISFPEEIPEELSENIRKLFDLEFNTPIAEHILQNKNLRITNFSFEVPSEWARGNKEMAMLSIITDKDFKNEKLYDLLKEATKKISSTSKIYKGFYHEDKISQKDEEVQVKYQELNDIFNDYIRKFESKVKEIKIMDLVTSKKLSLGGAYKVFSTMLTDIISSILQQNHVYLCGDMDASNSLFALLKRIFLEIIDIDDKISIMKEFTDENFEALVINTGLGIVESGETDNAAHASIEKYIQEADKTGDNDAAIILIRQKLSILLKVADLLEKILKEKKSVKNIIKDVKKHLRVQVKYDEISAVRLLLKTRGKKDVAEKIIMSKLDKF